MIEIQGVILNRYFLAQVVNLLFTVGAGAILESDFKNGNLWSVPKTIAMTFPALGGYFMELMVIKK